jgi:hypothetical protein
MIRLMDPMIYHMTKVRDIQRPHVKRSAAALLSWHSRDHKAAIATAGMRTGKILCSTCDVKMSSAAPCAAVKTIVYHLVSAGLIVEMPSMA